MTRTEYRAVLAYFGAFAEGGGTIGPVHPPRSKAKSHPAITSRKVMIERDSTSLIGDEHSHDVSLPEALTEVSNADV